MNSRDRSQDHAPASGARTIPEIRTRLHELAREHGLPELHALADETKRRHHGRRAPVRHPPLTPEQVEALKTYASANPRAHLQDIAVRFRTNAGRVSEALHGKRGEE